MIQIFNGKDTYLINNKIEAFLKKNIPEEWREMAITKYYPGESNESEVLADVATPPFGLPTKAVIVYGYNKFSKREFALEVAKACAEQCHLIMTQEAPGKKPAKLYKWITSQKGLASWTSFYPPEGKDIEKRIIEFFNEKKIGFDNEAIGRFSEAMQDQPEFLRGALEKIELYLGEPDQFFDLMCFEQLVSRYSDKEVFDIVGYIFSKQKKKSLIGFNSYVTNSGNFISLLMILQNEAYKIFRFKEMKYSGMSDKDAFTAMGIHFYKFQNKLSAQAKGFDLDLLAFSCDLIEVILM